jgi:capsular polysaccharide biosynthesis protein
MQASFSPRQEFLIRLSNWWVVLVLAIVGASVGYAVSFLIRPTYEAAAELNLAVDFSKTGMATDIEQDQIIEMVGDICKSPLVVDQVLAAYQGISEEEFWQMASLERRNMQWVMKIRNTDPIVAGEMAKTWQQISYQEISNAYQHAVVVDSLTDHLNVLTRCFEQSTPQLPGNAICEFQSVEELQTEISKVAEQMKTEQEKSYGISPAISVSAFASSDIPYQQVYGLKSLFTIAGGGLGLMAGMWVIAFLPNKRKMVDTL